jgi:hypothetical protein
MQATFKITANSEQNLLNIQFTGQVSIKESEQAIGVLVQEISKLTPGFSVISDLREFIFTDKNSLELLKNSMDYLKIRQVGKIVRVIGTNKQGNALFELTSKNILGYHACTVPSMDKAKQYLGIV